jgi:predicted RNA-binding Zn ribbon-like protein
MTTETIIITFDGYVNNHHIQFYRCCIITSGANLMGVVGGVLALDFANTIADGTERLSDVPALLDWALCAGVTNAAAMEQCRHDLRQDSKSPEALLRQAHNLRDLLLRLGTALARGDTPETADLNRLRSLAADALRDAEFCPDRRGGYVLSFGNGKVETAILGPVIWSAVELLREGEFQRVKQCPECRFLFFDRSKNNSRRWCDMATCGNRAKLRNFRERRRS